MVAIGPPTLEQGDEAKKALVHLDIQASKGSEYNNHHCEGIGAHLLQQALA